VEDPLGGKFLPLLTHPNVQSMTTPIKHRASITFMPHTGNVFPCDPATPVRFILAGDPKATTRPRQ